MMSSKRVAVIGGGAAGYFSAIAATEANPDCSVILYEATNKPLAKVLISGGGRCNVTHNCFDSAVLVQNYPRGSKELRGPFSRFAVEDTISWFAAQGVKLKAEADGRMFPITDSSQTIANALKEAAKRGGVIVRSGVKVTGVAARSEGEQRFLVSCSKGEGGLFSDIILATGGSRQGFELARALGHTIVAPVPSLFTFKVADKRLEELAGINFPEARITLKLEGGQKFVQSGPLLITHWGLSGPGIIKLSALAARELCNQNYQAGLSINLLPRYNQDTVFNELQKVKARAGTKEVRTVAFEGIPKRYWQNLIRCLGLADRMVWADLSKKHLRQLALELVAAEFKLQDKGVFKEEFVTSGGVALAEVDFRSMQSRICPGLYLAGEVLDIDGLTGGFNFQAAWTTGWIAGQAAATL